MGLPTSPRDATGGTAYEGRLRSDGSCIWLDVGGNDINLLWPRGFLFRPETGEIVSPAGQAVVKIGDNVFLEAALAENPVPVSGCRVRRAASIAEIVEVNGTRVAPTDKAPLGRLPPIR